MSLDLSRRARQQLGFDRWVAQVAFPPFGATLQAVTGFGKTWYATHAVEILNAAASARQIIVAVPGVDLYNDWTRQPTKRKPLLPGEELGHVHQLGLKNVRVMKPMDIVNAPAGSLSCDLLIIDEAHSFAATRFVEIFQRVAYRRVMCLTALLERLDGRHQIIEQYAPIVDTVTMVEALTKGWISPHITYNLAVRMYPEEQVLHDRVQKSFTYLFGQFASNFPMMMGCMRKGPMRDLLSVQNGWNPTLGKDHEWSPESISGRAVMCQRAMSQRMDLLYGLRSKRDIAVAVLLANKVKAITFGESVELAIQIADEVNAVEPGTAAAYHSKLKAAERRRLRARYADPADPLKRLCTAKALDQGFNAEDIELAIICAASSGKLQNIQRTGRAVRFVVGKTARIIQLYVPNTQDEKWLRSRQEGKGAIPAVWIADRSEIR